MHGEDPWKIVDTLAAKLATAEARLAEAERLLRWADSMVKDFPETYLLAIEAFLRSADSAAVDPERVEIARCPRCGGLPRPTLLGRTICDRCDGLDVPQPPSPTVLRQIEALNADSAPAYG